jgi:hypothetical protein
MDNIALLFNKRSWIPSSNDLLILVIVMIVAPLLVGILRYIYHRLRDQRINDSQLFLFKLKRLGLSNFQIKIINSVNDVVRFANPNRLLDNPEFFERAMGQLLTHSRGMKETEDSQHMICRDLSTIYDKLYHHARPRKQLREIQDLDDTHLLYFTIATDKVYMGKIVSRDAAHFYIKILGDPRDLTIIQENNPITFHVFRVGDAEYEFVSNILSRDGMTIKTSIPSGIIKREESRHPYIDVIFPAVLTRETDKKAVSSQEGEEQKEGVATDEAMVVDEPVEEKLSCLIYKLNDYEAVLRIPRKLDFNYRYALDFQLMDFNVRMITRIIASKTVEEGAVIYYTVKFESISENAKHVLKKYVYEHL